MEQVDEKGPQNMTQSVLDQASERIAETVHKTNRAAAAAVEAIEDRLIAAKRAVKHGSHVVEDAYGDAKRCVQKNPMEAIVATLAVGIAAGTALSWIMRRARRCCATAPTHTGR